MASSNGWDVDTPFVTEIDVLPAHIDRLAHVNNTVYLQFLEQAGWAHTQSLGLSWQSYQDLDAACVVRRHEVDYLAAAVEGDRLQVATWIDENDGRLAMWRGFQIRRARDQRNVLRARTQFVCIRLSSGRPRRMPSAFIDAYQPLVTA